uniref:SAM domain-containing protein n=1 Tax=Rhabditophanes sp. KR3021 TaxID=114890 RepID=A0AC35TTP6_9BILA
MNSFQGHVIYSISSIVLVVLVGLGVICECVRDWRLHNTLKNELARFLEFSKSEAAKDIQKWASKVGGMMLIVGVDYKLIGSGVLPQKVKKYCLTNELVMKFRNENKDLFRQELADVDGDDILIEKKLGLRKLRQERVRVVFEYMEGQNDSKNILPPSDKDLEEIDFLGI